jgi:outer membrane protein
MRTDVVLLLGLLLFPSAALTETVGLEQALREAVADRPQAVAARQQAVAARAAADEAGSRNLPRVTLSENFVWTNEPAGSLFISLNQEDLRLSSNADAYNFPPSRKDFENPFDRRAATLRPGCRLRTTPGRKECGRRLGRGRMEL